MSNAVEEYQNGIITFGDTLSAFIEDGTDYKEIVEKDSANISKQDKVFIIERGIREESDSIRNINVDYTVTFYISDLLNYKQEREEINKLEFFIANNITEWNIPVQVRDRGSIITKDEENKRTILQITLSFVFSK